MFTPLLMTLCCLAPAAAAGLPGADTLTARTVASAPRLDGRIGDAEYAAVSLRLPTTGAEVSVWVARHAGYVYVAASLPDSTYYWGDDLVVSADMDGSGGASPGVGDRQWYLRRDVDSSVVSVVTASSAGRWMTPGVEPARLRHSRGAGDWEVASASAPRGWSIELRIREDAFNASPAAAPRIAFRTYNDKPQGWWSVPAPPAGTPAQRVERTPDLWLPIRLR